MSNWLNNKIVVNPDLEKPCVKLRYCPYGQLIEAFPFDASGKLSCSWDNTDGLMQFGHNCPVHYHAEILTVDKNRLERYADKGGE